jgi:hypothetical protein
MTADCRRARDELDASVHNIEGVLSVGLGKSDNRAVLVVAIDSRRFAGGVPHHFQGYEVKLRDFGKAVAYGQGRT